MSHEFNESLINNYIPNTSAIPNILFDYWMEKLSPAEFKVLMCVARKTYGWHKTNDLISLKQIESMTNLYRSSIIKNIKRLEELGLINKIKSKTSDGDDAPNRYEINVFCLEGGSSLKRLGVVVSDYQGVVVSDYPQKKDYTKENIQEEKNSLKVLEEPAAKAAECGASPSKKIPNQEFSEAVKQLAKKMLEILAKHNPVYRPPDEMTKFLKAVQDLLEKDKQDPAEILRTFEWAVSDNEQRGDFKGWQGIIATNKKASKLTNPVEIFRSYFSKIHSNMKSRPVRKFAPSSDMERMKKGMDEMNSRAL